MKRTACCLLFGMSAFAADGLIPHPDAVPNSHPPGEVDNAELVPFIVADPASLPGIVVDETAATLVGKWQYSTHTPPYVGLGYLHDQKEGKGEKSATFTPDLPKAGLYEVRLAHCHNIRRATNTPVTIHHADGETTLRINQQDTPPHGRLFRTLGTFRFEKGRAGWARLSNEGTEGKNVIADAVQWLPVVEQAAVPDVFLLPAAEEPMLAALSLPKAAESLDRISLAWVQKRQCGSCHTGWPYLMARGVLEDTSSPALAEIRAFFEGRITNWDADEKVTKHAHREIVGTAAALALHDARSTGRLHAITRAALDRMWTLQRKDGAWNWPKCEWPPFEIDDYYGAVLAAVGTAHAPEHYMQGDSAKAGVEKLRAYLKNTAPPSLHHKTWLLWAAVELDGLMTAEEKQNAIAELRALQRGDGGWSMEALGKGWVGRKGEAAKPDAPSDGYGTGLVVYVLRQAGVPVNDAAVQRGKTWLMTNQRASGRWFTRSLNGIKQHFISDTASAFAVLALHACQ